MSTEAASPNIFVHRQHHESGLEAFATGTNLWLFDTTRTINSNNKGDEQHDEGGPADKIHLIPVAGFPASPESQPPSEGWPSAMSFSPDGKLLALLAGSMLELYAVTTGQLVSTLDLTTPSTSNHSFPALNEALFASTKSAVPVFSPCSRFIAISDSYTIVVIGDLLSSLSPPKCRVVAACRANKERGAASSSSQRPARQCHCLQWLPDRTALVALWNQDVSSSCQVSLLELPPAQDLTLASSKEGGASLTQLIHTLTETQPFSFSLHSQCAPASLLVTPNGREVLVQVRELSRVSSKRRNHIVRVSVEELRQAKARKRKRPEGEGDDELDDFDYEEDAEQRVANVPVSFRGASPCFLHPAITGGDPATLVYRTGADSHGTLTALNTLFGLEVTGHRMSRLLTRGGEELELHSHVGDPDFTGALIAVTNIPTGPQFVEFRTQDSRADCSPVVLGCNRARQDYRVAVHGRFFVSFSSLMGVLSFDLFLIARGRPIVNGSNVALSQGRAAAAAAVTDVRFVSVDNNKVQLEVSLRDGTTVSLGFERS